MTGKRKRHPAAFKARVALEAAKQSKTVAELAKTYQVHPVQISQWKKQLLDGVESLFRDGRRREHDDSQAIQAELYEQIGRLKMELEWLKKKLPAAADLKRALVEPSSTIRASSAMRTPRPQPLELLSAAGRRVGGEPAADAVDRRAVHEDAVLRQSADDGCLGAIRGDGQSQAGAAADAADGPGSDFSQAADHRRGARHDGFIRICSAIGS